jgi:MerR family transcriptional regulator, heat shock protein HspR
MSAGTREPLGGFAQPPPEAPVYVISVAAELTGLHPQTLRAYDRIGLVKPGRAGGGGRRYSWHDIEMLREVAELTGAGIGLEGVRRILALENQIDALRVRVSELEEELAVSRYRDQPSHRQTRHDSLTNTQNPNLPALRPASTTTGQAITVWRRGRI